MVAFTVRWTSPAADPGHDLGRKCIEHGKPATFWEGGGASLRIIDKAGHQWAPEQRFTIPAHNFPVDIEVTFNKNGEIGEGDDIDYLAAEGRVLSFLHLALITSPTSFVVRYCDPEFIHTFFQCRGKWATMKVIGFFIMITLMPFILSNCILSYPCDKNDLLIQEVGQHNGTTTTGRSVEMWVWEPHCEVQDWMRSKNSLGIGPTCFCLCFLVWLPFSHSQQYGFVCRCIMKGRHLMHSVAYNGLGPRWSLRGTQGLTAQVLAEKHGLTHKLSWMNDFFGAPDIYLFAVLMNCTILLSMVLVPVVVSVSQNGISGLPKGLVVGGGISLLLGRGLLHLTDIVLGAPSNLVRAVDMSIERYELPLETAIKNGKFEEEVEKARKIVEGILNGLGKGSSDLPKLLKDLKSLRMRKPNFSSSVTAGKLLHLLSHNSGDVVALTRRELSRLAWMNIPGLMLGMIDPEYRVLGREPFNFQKSMVLQKICFIDDRKVLVDADGSWKLMHEEAEHPEMCWLLSNTSASTDDDSQP